MIIEIYEKKEKLLYTFSTRWFNYNYTTKTLSFINCTKSGAGVFEYIETVKLKSFWVASGETLAIAILDENSEIPTL